MLKTLTDKKPVIDFKTKPTMSFNMEIYRYLVLNTPLNSWPCHFFWSVFSLIWTDYEDLQSKFQYSVRRLENTGYKILLIWKLFTQCFSRESKETISILMNKLIYGKSNKAEKNKQVDKLVF